MDECIVPDFYQSRVCPGTWADAERTNDEQERDSAPHLTTVEEDLHHVHPGIGQFWDALGKNWQNWDPKTRVRVRVQFPRSQKLIDNSESGRISAWDMTPCHCHGVDRATETTRVARW